MRYHKSSDGKIYGKYIPLIKHSDYINKLEVDLKSQRLFANELIAAIRANCAAGTLVTSDYQLIEEWLQPFIARIIPYKVPTVLEE